MVHESIYFGRILDRNFNKSIVMTEKNYEDVNNFTKCWICKKWFKK